MSGTEAALNLDNAFDWDLKVIVSDKIGSTTYNLQVPKGMPLIYFDRVKSSTGFNCFPANSNSVESCGLVLDDVKYVGSQVLYDSYTITGAGTASVLGAYDYKLIDGLFAGITVPAGYEKAYRLTAQVCSYNNNQISIALNNISSNGIGTWSQSTFRAIVSTRIFKQSEISLENVFGYESGRSGCNLRVTSTASSSGNTGGQVWNITLHGYIVKESTTFTDAASSEPVEQA